MNYINEPKIATKFANLFKNTNWPCNDTFQFLHKKDQGVSPENKRHSREWLILDEQEEIIFFHRYIEPHLLSESKDELTVITTGGICMFPKIYEQPGYDNFISWANLQDVKYQDLYLIFHTTDSEVPTAEIPVSRFVPDNIKASTDLEFWGMVLESRFNELANMVQPAADPLDEIREIYNKSRGEAKVITDAIQQIEKYIEKYIKEETRKNKLAEAYDYLSILNFEIDNCKEALNHINKSLELIDDKGSHSIRGVIKSKLGEDAPYSILTELVNYKQNSYLFKEEYCKEVFNQTIEKYTDNFTSIPPENRKFIILSESFDVLPNDVYVLPLHHLPKDITIMGDPEDSALYIRHPYNPNKYILAERYSIEIFRDKIEEFQNIMASVGAKHIDYIDTYNSEQKTNTAANKKGSAQAKGMKRGIEVKGESQNELDEQFAFLDSVQENCNYKLTKRYPQLPAVDKLFWYPHESKWQTLIEQRFVDMLDTLTFEVSVSREETIAEHTRKKIEVAMNLVLGNVNAEGEIQKDWKFEKKSCRTWKCKVEFYPLSDYTKPEEVQPLPNFSDAELEYIERYKEALEDDGIIDEKEKNSLVKYCERHGISAKRAQELEKSISKLSPEEEEYIALYHEAVEDDGVVDTKERTRLDNYCKRHHISADRAKELEKL